MIAHILPCILEVEIFAAVIYLFQHASVLLAVLRKAVR